jgi:hypothetical protein
MPESWAVEPVASGVGIGSGLKKHAPARIAAESAAFRLGGAGG